MSYLVVAPRFHEIDAFFIDLSDHENQTVTHWCWLTKHSENETADLLHEGANRLPLFLFPLENLDTSSFYLTNQLNGQESSAHSSEPEAIASYLQTANRTIVVFEKKPLFSNPSCGIVTKDVKKQLQKLPPEFSNSLRDIPLITVHPLYDREFCLSEPIHWVTGLSKYSPYSLFYALRHYSFNDLSNFLQIEYPQFAMLLNKPSKIEPWKTLLKRAQERDSKTPLKPLTGKKFFERIALLAHEIGSPFGPKNELQLNSYSLFLSLLEQTALDRTYGHVIEWIYLKPKPTDSTEFLLEVEKLSLRSSISEDEILNCMEYLYALFKHPIQQRENLQKIISLSRQFFANRSKNDSKLPSKQLFSKYFWEKIDPLHRYGPSTQKLRNIFESIILEQPYSPWAGAFSKWLEENYVEGVPTKYLSSQERACYIAQFDGNKIISPCLIFPSDRIMYVIDEQENIYLAQKARGTSTIPSFAHSTLMAGESVVAAGTLKVNGDGIIERLGCSSGHYRPGHDELDLAKKIFEKKGVVVDKSY